MKHNIVGNLYSFNTDRQYDKHGQLIFYRLLDNGWVLFSDVSRNLDGKIQLHMPKHMQEDAEMQEIIMFHYDRYDYISINYREISEQEFLLDVKKEITKK